MNRIAQILNELTRQLNHENNMAVVREENRRAVERAERSAKFSRDASAKALVAIEDRRKNALLK